MKHIQRINLLSSQPAPQQRPHRDCRLTIALFVLSAGAPNATIGIGK